MVYEKQKMEPPVPREFFDRIFNLIREKSVGYMFVSETPNGEAVAAHLNLYGKTVSYTHLDVYKRQMHG